VKGKLVEKIKVIIMGGLCSSLLAVGRVPVTILSEIWAMGDFGQRSI
jgi:hypothetical protein